MIYHVVSKVVDELSMIFLFPLFDFSHYQGPNLRVASDSVLFCFSSSTIKLPSFDVIMKCLGSEEKVRTYYGYRKMLPNEYLLFTSYKIGFDRAENEPSNVFVERVSPFDVHHLNSLTAQT